MRVITSASAAVRLDAAQRFVLALPPAAPVLVVSASRGAADDFARNLARTRIATFGLHRFSLTQLAARLAAPLLAREGVSPTTALGVQAVAARALFDADADHALSYFGPVAGMPGFPRALARTLEELALAGVAPSPLRTVGDGGPDLAGLFERFDAQFQSVSAVDRAEFFRVATRAAEGEEGNPDNPYQVCHLVLLDVPLANATERAFVEALARRAPDAFATVPDGDLLTLGALGSFGPAVPIDRDQPTALDAVRKHLFASTAPAEGGPMDEVELFSAPGEGREAVEIARRVLREARRGVPFDRIAIALRAPQQYAGLLEHALERAGVPAYFERGTRRPHPAGRAFLALIACALEQLSANRFAEYLSLGQVPDRAAVLRDDPFPLSNDEVFGALSERAEGQTPPEDSDGDEGGQPGGGEGADTPTRRAVRAPWRWERLLAESRVVSSEARWERRLAGLIAECELQQQELARTEPEAPRIDLLSRKMADLKQLTDFALPIVRTLARWPARATWADWLDEFDALAPRALHRPDRVLRVLADLRPMGAVGPVTLAEAARVLTTRLASIEAEPPARRYGRVLVATPSQLRGRAFQVVFIPALAERLFPQKPREDPLLLDDARRGLDAGLQTQDERAELEKLQLRLAVGAAESRLYVSFPTVEIGEGRPRVPSLYALEVWRAMTGRVPSADELQQSAARVSGATLAWPAPANREEAIDVLEHDLSTLRGLVDEHDSRARGRAHYMLRLNDCLQRSVRERFMRAKRAWSHWDGIVTATDRLQPILDEHRLGARRYSLSALQKYSVCPYQFLLSAIYRIRPADDLLPLQRLDPLTRGSLFHAMQTAFYRQLHDEHALPVRVSGLTHALAVLDRAIAAIAADHYELLAPAIDRVWHDEIAAIRRDLRLWVDEIAGADGQWVPARFEWAFGFKDGGALAVGRDPTSRSEPVTIDGRFQLHGAVDLVEERAGTLELRVTDHKTGKYRGKEHMIVGGGAVLQPVLYSLALEEATGRRVVEGRLYYATTAGGYKDVRIPLTPQARRLGVEVLEIIDRGIASGFLAPAPIEKACSWCDFRAVCGPTAERRTRHKAHEPLADLLELRRKP
ncbi:MAG: PD-(D/E)XK nuclease family protein [Gemmatimonadales bacterium]